MPRCRRAKIIIIIIIVIVLGIYNKNPVICNENVRDVPWFTLFASGLVNLHRLLRCWITADARSGWRVFPSTGVRTNQNTPCNGREKACMGYE